MSFRPPSLVSPTSAFTERTSALPGRPSVHGTTAFDSGADGQGIRERDRRLDGAELLDLSGARQLAESVADEHRAGHLLLEHVAAMRDDDGDAGAGAVALIEREVARPTPRPRR